MIAEPGLYRVCSTHRSIVDVSFRDCVLLIIRVIEVRTFVTRVLMVLPSGLVLDDILGTTNWERIEL